MRSDEERILLIIEPLAQSAISGAGVKETDLETVKRLIAKYQMCAKG